MVKSIDDCDIGDDGKMRMSDSSKRFYYFMQTLNEKLGLEEFTSLKTWRASFAELLGMGVLVFSMDTMVIGTLETNTQNPNLVFSIFAALTLSIMLLAVFPISGGHLNPAISWSAAFVGLISISRAIIYTIAQSIGAVLGALALKAVLSSEIQKNFSLGGCTLTVIAPGPDGAPTHIGIGTSQGLWLEILSMFAVLFAAAGIGMTRSRALGPSPLFMFSIIGIMVGLLTYVTTTVTTVKGYAGSGMNPARCIGPAIVRGGVLWDRHWVFWVGPGIAVVLFYVYTKIIPSDTFYTTQA
ncbi:probable aquaporin TIP3-2 [Macadamia integrifolia]|uniref:probable aquaporin TIP3-2 n=1 Tax=Macadamia integrifolia TaxID=60698 RepID=UPI001C4FB0E1|nr:probable aquaporin TIP3-2 [Macadamia integrifolia]